MHGFKSSAYAAGSLAALLLISQPVFGFDKSGNEIADTFLSNMEANGAENLTVGSVTGDAGRTEITDIKATVKDDGDTASLSIASIVFEGASVKDGRLMADKASITSMAIDGGPELKVSLGSAFADQIVMPKAEDVRANPTNMKSQATYRHAEFSDIQFTTENGGVIPVQSAVVDMSDLRDGIPHAGSVMVTGATINKAVLDGDGQQAFDRLGYEEVTLSLATKGMWDSDSGLLTIEEIKLSGEKVGTLTISAKLGGLTKEVAEQLENNDDPQQALGALQNVSVHGVSIRIDNDSVVERALDAQAKEMGVDRDSLAAQLTGMLPMFTSALQNKEFEAEIAKAAGTFLKERKSIMAVAAPAQPIPAAQIMGAAMVAPQTIPTVLGVKLSNP